MQDSSVAVFVAAASQVLLALFGVDYYAMLWAFVGSLLALSQVKKMTRSRAIVYVLLSTLVGAALGTGCVVFFEVKARAALLVTSLVGGAGSQLFVTALIQGALFRIKSTLGGAHEPSQPAR